MRQYIMVYSWLSGIDAWQAKTMGLLSEDEVRKLNDRATDEIRTKGFSVLDMKPAHLIVQPAGPELLIGSDGRIAYGLVDFELLERTREHWQELKAARMDAYQRRKRELLHSHDGVATCRAALPANLHAVRIFEVDYIHGRAESTGGMLWVVGREPELFDFFLPERWRTTPQIRFMDIHETYFTTSKDNIRFVWKVSRLGERPEAAAFGADGFRVLANGFNSPFEEFAAAWWLRRRGIPAILPRAVYRTGHRSKLDGSLFDPSRYQTHARFRALDGEPILQSCRNYITVWDYWNGPDQVMDDGDSPVSRSVSAEQAVERGLLGHQESLDLVAELRERLSRESVEVFRLVPTHILLSMDADQALARDEKGRLKYCLCNFQHLRLPTWKDETRQPVSVGGSGVADTTL